MKRVNSTIDSSAITLLRDDIEVALNQIVVERAEQEIEYSNSSASKDNNKVVSADVSVQTMLSELVLSGESALAKLTRSGAEAFSQRNFVHAKSLVNEAKEIQRVLTGLFELQSNWKEEVELRQFLAKYGEQQISLQKVAQHESSLTTQIKLSALLEELIRFLIQLGVLAFESLDLEKAATLSSHSIALQQFQMSLNELYEQKI